MSEVPYDPAGSLPLGKNPFAGSGASDLARIMQQARLQLASQPQRLPAPDDGPIAGDVNATLPEGYADPNVGVGAHVKHMVESLMTLPKRAIDASGSDVQNLGDHSKPLQSIAPAVETAIMMTGGAGAFPAEASSLRAGIMPRRMALPMDEASRAARARQMGFNIDEPLFHGSGKEFSEFDLNKAGIASGSRNEKAVFLSPSPTEAEHFSRQASIRAPAPGETPHDSFEYMGNTYHNVYDGAQIYPAVVKPGRQMVVDLPHYNTKAFEDAIAKAREQGYDTLRFRGVSEGRGPVDQIAVLKPENIRSPLAAFDPTKVDSRNLLAGIGGAAGFGTLAQQGMQPNQNGL